MTHHDQLLVMAAAAAGPGVEQYLPAVLVDLPDELGVGLLGLLQRLGLRTPEQAVDQDLAARGLAQYLADLGPRAVEALVKVPPEVQEVHLVSRLGRLELGTQAGEIAAAVHQRADQVSGGESPEVGGQVGPVSLAEEPQPDSRIVGHVIGGILLERVIRRVRRIWKHVRIVAPSGRSRPAVPPGLAVGWPACFLRRDADPDRGGMDPDFHLADSGPRAAVQLVEELAVEPDPELPAPGDLNER